MSGQRTQRVCASDGTELAVEEIGPPGAALTVVFSHGFCLSMAAWAPQRQHLATYFGDDVRMVFYDHRGHGASAVAPAETYTIRQLGDDLDAVITQTAPSGRVVLAGHSMGGMAILAFAARHAETLRRVAGVALVSTAADQLDSCGIGRALRTPAVPLLRLAAQRFPRQTMQAWALARTSVAPLLGIPAMKSPAMAANSQCCRMIGQTPISTIAALLMDFRAYEQKQGISALTHLPALVACGERDPITPLSHSARLARGLAHAEFVRVPGAGHMLELERPRLISTAISKLVARARAYDLACVG
ncbi:MULTISPECIES: alpha/beta fold hydrolase [Mycolicibacter]|uniref:Alpha/beta hydrolase n=2 Tax=Mycolicibacter TaxID=1073531 RepID=A0ABU5XMB4_9MYCO|nr:MULTISPECIES: alpha/beta hydrolase [unclassified Mycolicibacter]MEB3023407.1 alpha/beta hydrolase [Mycolicibacter sp. MYC098]MEB3033749.1 alpha/beta hydrolase [Mycolicibacter sp. MYC340]